MTSHSDGSVGDERSLLEAMADTMRGVLMQVNSGPPFYLGGAMRQQIREDLTAYDLLHLDEVFNAQR
jgi:hypothetical protein